MTQQGRRKGNKTSELHTAPTESTRKIVPRAAHSLMMKSARGSMQTEFASVE
jgi:hypothetical protein